MAVPLGWRLMGEAGVLHLFQPGQLPHISSMPYPGICCDTHTQTSDASPSEVWFIREPVLSHRASIAGEALDTLACPD